VSPDQRGRCGNAATSFVRWALITLLIVCGLRPLHAHNFPGITADALFVSDTVVMTLDIRIVEALVILKDERPNGEPFLTRAEIEAGMPTLRAYLERTVLLRVDGKAVRGRCMGLNIDLSAFAAGDVVDRRLPFIMAWESPREVRSVDFEFGTFLPKQFARGMILATLHRGKRVYAQLAEVGTVVHFAVLPESELIEDLSGTAGYGSTDAAAAGGEAAIVETSGLSAWRLLVLGFSHIVPEGLDHILFVLCLFLLSPRMKPLLIQVTAFTVAHSVTLGLAMAGIVLLPSRLVETLIALSIVVMAVENCFMREVKPWRWSLVFVFGLVHGLGFAGSFSMLRLAEGDFTRSLLLLNVGIEFGQLAVVATAAALTCALWRFDWYRTRVTIPASVAIALLATWWTIERGFGL
jgi:hypothetical protein